VATWTSKLPARNDATSSGVILICSRLLPPAKGGLPNACSLRRAQDNQALSARFTRHHGGVSVRDLIVLGSASAVPTKARNHNGYLLRWDGHGVLFDPGEGTQRQMSRAGVSAHDVTWICVTHFHGDHCLGVPGVVQRIARDGVEHPVDAAFPASGRTYWERLRHATVFRDTDVVRERPVSGERMRLDTGDAPFTLEARRLSHPVEAYGYRLEDPDGRTMLPEELAARGVRGPLIRRLQEEGRITAPDGRTVTLEECSVPRPGQKVAFV